VLHNFNRDAIGTAKRVGITRQ